MLREKSWKLPSPLTKHLTSETGIPSSWRWWRWMRMNTHLVAEGCQVWWRLLSHSSNLCCRHQSKNILDGGGGVDPELIPECIVCGFYRLQEDTHTHTHTHTHSSVYVCVCFWHDTQQPHHWALTSECEEKLLNILFTVQQLNLVSESVVFFNAVFNSFYNLSPLIHRPP